MSFDPAAFLQNTIGDSLSTSYVVVPEGEYNATIGEVDDACFRQIETRDGPRVVLDVPWIIDDAAVAEITHRKENRVRQGIFLDVILDTQGRIVGLDLAKGANVPLGRLRQALGQNKPGAPWSFGMLSGGSAVVEVTHSVDGDRIYANVTSVRPL